MFEKNHGMLTSGNGCDIEIQAPGDLGYKRCYDVLAITWVKSHRTKKIGGSLVIHQVVNPVEGLYDVLLLVSNEYGPMTTARFHNITLLDNDSAKDVSWLDVKPGTVYTFIADEMTTGELS